MQMSSMLRAAALIASITIATACASDSPSAPAPERVQQVLLVGLPDRLGWGDVAAFEVQVKGDGGRDLPGRAVTLASSNPAVALIDAAGRVRAVDAGTATIRATVEGVVASMEVTVESAPAVLTLRRLDGTRLPTLIASGDFDIDGVVEYREVYLESGSLQLTGGEHPAYQTLLHFAAYAVTFDDAGQRHFVLRTALDLRDHGSVHYDARGDLVMTSADVAALSHTASAESTGFSMRYWIPDTAGEVLFFRREPE